MRDFQSSALEKFQLRSYEATQLLRGSFPMAVNRREAAFEGRVSAAKMARDRVHPDHIANGDEQRYATAHYPMSFTKGLNHDKNTGLVAEPSHFEAFRQAIDEGWIEPFTTRVPVPKPPKGKARRKWEAPTAGVVYELEGPDPQAVTMLPAPELCSDELTFEMAEVYELALLRDVPFSEFASGGAGLTGAVARLNALPFAQAGFPGTRGRTSATPTTLDAQTAFRGSSPGCDVGPYLSQLMLVGTRNQAGTTDLEDGFISFGAQKVDQRVLVAANGDDYMQTWETWFAVQQGFDVNMCGPGQCFPSGDHCFIKTPRDLASYVHYDALYQAYLNACLILLGMGTPFDPGFANLSGMREVHDPSVGQPQNAGGFALYGGPHILTLVTEVATRALKAVRFQKFNNHLRLRPEALAARIAKAEVIEKHHPSLCGALTKMCEDLLSNVDSDGNSTLSEIASVNQSAASEFSKGNFLLPMAFGEGSPMHPAYGAGHATVAGACVTVLKAFFDTGTVLGKNSDKKDCNCGKDGFYRKISEAAQYVPPADGCDKLDRQKIHCPLTLEGELNKLAANISIGRNMAGVHYYSDYYDSLRMGEEIAIGMLEEQAICYPTDPFILSVPTFDGRVHRIGRR
ncbi:MAG: vanadium-dependent haloperoxidase [Pseudomonadota bacterium]